MDEDLLRTHLLPRFRTVMTTVLHSVSFLLPAEQRLVREPERS